MPNVHAKKSPSSSKRWMTCAGSNNLIDKLIEDGAIPEDSTSKYAAEGTVAHDLGEICLRDGVHPSKFLGEKREADGFTFTVNQNMLDAVEVYVNYINDQIHDALVQADIDLEMHLEVWCSLSSLGVIGMDGGTTDCMLINREHEVIENIDYKHGAGVPVDVIGNTQTMMYSVGALLKLQEEGVDISNWQVYNTIVQPRAAHRDGPIRTESMSATELLEWSEETLIPAGHACDEEDAPLVPSDEGCRFCPAAGSCTALYEKTQMVAISDFEDDSFPDPRIMTKEQKIIVMDHIDVIRSYLVAVENQVKLEMDGGSNDYEGKYKLVRKTAHRKFTEDAFDEDFSPLLDHMEPEEMYTKKPKGIGDIEKVLKKKFREEGYKGKGLDQIVGDVMSDVTIKPEGDIVVAPMSDKRSAVPASAVGDFSNLEQN